MLFFMVGVVRRSGGNSNGFWEWGKVKSRQCSDGWKVNGVGEAHPRFTNPRALFGGEPSPPCLKH